VLNHSGDEFVFREEGLHRLDVVDPDDSSEELVEQVVVDVVEPDKEREREKGGAL
jgi:hypothetical protein